MSNNTLVLYVHGKGGTPEEAEHYKPLFPHCDIVGLDYKAETPWEAKAEFPIAFETLSIEYSPVILIANSIGAYFSMCALPQEKIEKAYFISPIVDMEKLIGNMMNWANVGEDELWEKGNGQDASLTVMENGEHWFHTPVQMAFLDAWLMRFESAERKSL